MPKYLDSTRSIFPTVLQNLASVSFFLAMVGIPQWAVAQPKPEPLTTPVRLDLLQQGLCAPEAPGISDSSVSQTELTQPSLWWIQDQISAQEKYGRKLIDRWLACKSGAQANRVDVLVNPQLWSLLDFFERYEFVNRFGTVTTGYGYNLRVFNRQGVMLAAYTCDFKNPSVAEKPADPEDQEQQTKQLSSQAQPLVCAFFDTSAKTNFWTPAKPSGGAFPTTGGTAQP
jgi:hypothetical protein